MESIPLLDAQVDYQVNSLPGKITRAMDDIISSTQTTNQVYGGIVTGIVGAQLINILSGTIEDTDITAGDVLATVVGPALLTTTFAASRVARVSQSRSVLSGLTSGCVSDHESSSWL